MCVIYSTASELNLKPSNFSLATCEWRLIAHPRAAAEVSRMDEEEARCFLGRFVEEFPAALEEDHPLPVKPLSNCISLDELHGESLQLGLKLLAARYGWEGETLLSEMCVLSLWYLTKAHIEKSNFPKFPKVLNAK